MDLIYLIYEQFSCKPFHPLSVLSIIKSRFWSGALIIMTPGSPSCFPGSSKWNRVKREDYGTFLVPMPTNCPALLACNNTPAVVRALYRSVWASSPLHGLLLLWNEADNPLIVLIMFYGSVSQTLLHSSRHFHLPALVLIAVHSRESQITSFALSGHVSSRESSSIFIFHLVLRVRICLSNLQKCRRKINCNEASIHQTMTCRADSTIPCAVPWLLTFRKDTASALFPNTSSRLASCRHVQNVYPAATLTANVWSFAHWCSGHRRYCFPQLATVFPVMS